MMKNERLLKIIYILIEKEFVTAKELAETLEVSIRTIYRDIDSLTAAKIPVYTTSGKGGGVGLLEDFVIDKSHVTSDEQQKIIKALESTKKAPTLDVDDTINKLQSLFEQERPSVTSDWLEVDLSRWGSSKDNEKFEELKQAIENHLVCQFVYFTPTAKQLKEVEPVRLIFKSNTWYLQAFTKESRDYRIYKLSQILNLRVQNNTFNNHQDVPSIMLSDSFPNLYEEVVIKFPETSGYKLLEDFEQDQVIELENGDYQVVARIPIDRWLVSYILSFGQEVEIYKPENLKRKVKEEVRRLNLKYNE